MSFINKVPSVPSIRPSLNIGCLFDIPTGTYHQAENGSSSLNGGMPAVCSIAGPGNSFKSAISLFFHLTLAERYKDYTFSIYDTEGSMSYTRINTLARRFPKLSQIPHGDESLTDEDKRVVITSSVDMLGDVYFEHWRKHIEESRKKQKLFTTVFTTKSGKPVQMPIPNGVIFDSISEFKDSSSVTNIVEKNSLGESGGNMLHLRLGLVKKNLVSQLPRLAEQSGARVTMVAHVGDEFNLDGMFAPVKHKLTHAKRGSKVIGATKAFEFINEVLWEIFGAKLLNNKPNRTGVLYPILPCDREEACIDLLMITLKPTRNKAGLSGVVIPLIVSQREGVLPHLSQYDYIKTRDTHGLTRVGHNYHLDILPDTKFSRTTIRGLCDTDRRVQRALEFTSDVLQMEQYWEALAPELQCTMSQLYEDITAMGYDWTDILNTRPYHVFMEHVAVEELPEFTTFDLLRLRAGQYKPKWLKVKS